MSTTDSKPRRPHGAGSLYVRTDSAGRQTWYAHWRSNKRQVKRRIGLKRTEGKRDGLTRTQAEAELRRLMAEVVATPSAGERLTVAELGERYVRYLENLGRKPSTIAAVRGHVKHWHAPYFSGRSLDAIKAEDVAELVRLMRAGDRPGGLTRTKPLTPKSIRNAVGTLSAMLGYAVRKRWSSANPVDEVELPAVDASTEIRFLTPDEVRVLADAAIPGDYRTIDRALILTAAMTGLREGELIALRWRDVDWLAGRVRVRQNHVLGEFGTPKSKRSTRSVPMADEVARDLDRMNTGAGSPDDDVLVFPDPITGEPLAKAALLRRYRKALKAAKLDEARRFHDLRHSFGTAMAAAGVPMRTLQEWMGHRDIQTTMRYADYAPSAHEAAMVAAAFGGSNRGSNASESENTSADLALANMRANA